ncbi:MAG: fibronectin type III domain-containing protein [Bacteroidota bacterium]
MKKNIPLFVLVLMSVFISCADEEQVIIVPTPSDFEIGIKNILPYSVDLEWTASTASDGSTIKYDIYLGGSIIKENHTSTKYVLEGLNSKSFYLGKIIANSSNGKSKEELFEFITKEDLAPSVFEVTVGSISTTNATISWTEATLPNNEEVVYDLYLDDILIKNDITTTEFLLENLSPFKKYTIKIVAKSKTNKGTYQEITFKTLGTPPSQFPLAIEDTSPAGITVYWTTPTVEDGSFIYYQIYVDNEKVGQYTINEDSNNITDYYIRGLEEGKEYTVKIIAVASNNTSTEESITFTTRTYPSPSDFEISIKYETSDLIIVNWTPSTMEDGTQVIYFLYLNGEQAHPEYTHLGGLKYKLENFDPNTEYTVKLVAEETKFRKTTEKEFTFTSHSIHPGIDVEKATLYRMHSTYFPGQLNVKFTQNIESVDVVGFHGGVNIEIPSYILYPSAISSPKLSLSDYNEIGYLKYGYVLIKENGVTYILDFNVVIETN